MAESYRLLEALHPGRIDLGIGRAPGTDQLTAVALRRSRSAPLADDFLTQLAELSGFGDGTLPPGHPFAKVRAMPDDVSLPPIWLLGSSDYSAKRGGRTRPRFRVLRVISAQIRRSDRCASIANASSPEPWRRRTPSLALSVFCAEEEAAAKRLASSMLLAFAQLRAGRAGPACQVQKRRSPTAIPLKKRRASRSFVGFRSPARRDAVRRGIERMAESTGGR